MTNVVLKQSQFLLFGAWTYRYYVHNYNERGKNSLLLADSEASVKVYYNDNGTTNVTTFNVPNSAADLWYVFDFDNSSGFTAVNNMGSDDKLNPRYLCSNIN